MVKIKPFAVEEWMDVYQPDAKHDIAETCCASISIEALQSLCDDKEKSPIVTPSAKLAYGHIKGTPELRQNLARLYSSKAGSALSPDNVLITPGAIAANHLIYYALVAPGDHVICHYPTYQQLYCVPESLGAEVDLWKGKPEKEWIPDIEELKAMIKPNTKIITINNPNNPTGACIKKQLLQQIVDLAAEHNITILADEVYRPVFHSISPMDPDFPPSLLNMGYNRVLVTGSLSKAYSLAGIRVGWIACRNPELLEQVYALRHYTTISVSQVDEQFAAFALDSSTVHNLLGRNLTLSKKNLEALEKFISRHDDCCQWVKPSAGTTAFVKFHKENHPDQPVDSTALCKALIEKYGILLVPGDTCFGDEFKGYVRIGFVQDAEALQEGLNAFKTFMKKDFDDLPLA